MVRVVRLRFLSMDSRVGWLVNCLASLLFSCLCLVWLAWFFWLMCLVSRVGWLVCVRRLLLLIPPPRGWCWGWLDCLVGCYWLVTGCSFYDTSWLLRLLYMKHLLGC